MKGIATCLMFSGDQHGKAEEAITFYTSLFDNSKILDIETYGSDDLEPEGTVKIARFCVNGVDFKATDSSYDHKFNFTPSISLFVECESEDELESSFARLVDGGMALMPLDNYGFSSRFGWVQDRYGVSWQLNLA